MDVNISQFKFLKIKDNDVALSAFNGLNINGRCLKNTVQNLTCLKTFILQLRSAVFLIFVLYRLSSDSYFDTNFPIKFC